MMRRLFLLVIVLVALGAAWIFQDDLMAMRDRVRARVLHSEVGGGLATPAAMQVPAITEAVADAAQKKLDRMQHGQSSRASFTTPELQSLLQFRYRQLLPAYIDSPRVKLSGDQVELRMRVPTQRLPQVQELQQLAAFLPDTADLNVTGAVLPSDEGHIAFAVNGVSAQHIPLPKRFVPAALEMLGREDKPGLPADAIVLPLPRGVRSAYVRADSLVLLGGKAPARE